ncbi:hypothetical protein Clacol_004996 [Clathrus columnatus]|uniref:Uncharacterized protein n=1 Tax=Clathrus columnatus TaxID=1419009 RepID=A0AAV5ADP1_9AGAM|nr:hypothetical protein Clacol_004996 [Clathrus columnatus]
MQTYLFVREISSRIVVPGPLSSFWMNFKNEHYLSISFHEPRGPFLIHAGCDSNSVCREWRHIDNNNNDPLKGFPLSLLGRPKGKIDHSRIVDLIRGMPEVRHLQLTRFDWRLWASWNLDVSATFPHSKTLELSNPILDRSGLTPLLGFRNLKIQTFILKGLKGPRIHVYLLVLSEIVSKTGMKTLQFESCHIKKREILDVLPKQGINVVLIEWDLDMVNLSLSGI